MMDFMKIISQNQGLGTVFENIGFFTERMQAGANEILAALKELVSITKQPSNYIPYVGTTAAAFTESNTRPFAMNTKVVDVWNLSAASLIFQLLPADGTTFGGDITLPGNSLYSITIKAKGIKLRNGSGAADYQVITFH